MKGWNKYSTILDWIRHDPRYLWGIEYGEPRPGQPEGTVKAHIKELEDALSAWLIYPQWSQLKILIHVHDTFKRQGKEYTNGRVALAHQHSHASLASDYLRRLGLFDLSGIVQYHDEPFALYRKYLNKGSIDFSRIRKISVRA